ncbi:unnamed protein product [Cochlearia groenlandica]
MYKEELFASSPSLVCLFLLLRPYFCRTKAIPEDDEPLRVYFKNLDKLRSIDLFSILWLVGYYCVHIPDTALCCGSYGSVFLNPETGYRTFLARVTTTI